MVDQALSDMRVIDLTHYISGPACTKRLADYGAEVIKIERPGVGDGARSMGPFYHDEPHPEKSGLFLYLNTNKRGITLNLKSQLGKEILRELVKKADVVVENFKPGVMERLSLSYDDLSRINPKLVMTSISNFGQAGPYKDYEFTELIAFGMGGSMHLRGLPDREPLKYGETPSLYHAGVVAAMATLLAYLGMRRFGQGEYIDISIMETQAGNMDSRANNLVNYQYTGRVTPRSATLGHGIATGTYPCADGYVFFVGEGPRLAKTTELMGNPPQLMDPKFYTPQAQGDPATKKEYESYLLAWLMEHTKQEIVQLSQAAGIICSPLNTVDAVVQDPQIQFREAFVEIERPMAENLKYPGRPFIMQKTPWTVRRPAPMLGEYNLEVYSELGFTREEIVRMRETGII